MGIELMSNREVYSLSQINNWENMVLSHKLQKTKSWNMFSIHWHRLLRTVSKNQCPGHDPGDCHTCEGEKCHQAWVDYPALTGTEININIARWKLGRRTSESSLVREYTQFLLLGKKKQGPKRTTKRIIDVFQRLIQGMQIVAQET